MNESSGAVASVPQSSTQRVFQDLRRRIIEGEIEPGERLKVESLKTLLDSGASPIREALSLLTSEQLVERIDQRGFRAAPASKEHFREILMLRCELEDIALRASIKSGNEQWEEQVVLSHHRLAKAKIDDVDTFEQLHYQFHRSLLASCGSPILLRFTDQLYSLNIRYRNLAGKSVRYGKRDIAKEHEQIVDSVLSRDEDEASSHLLSHYRSTGDFLERAGWAE